MRMRAETHAWHHDVIIDDSQAAKAHPFRIVIIGETESVIGVQPPVACVAPFVCSSNFHHDLPCHSSMQDMKDYVSWLSITCGYTKVSLLTPSRSPNILRHADWATVERIASADKDPARDAIAGNRS